MANTDYGAVLLTACEATSQALNHRLGVSTGFKPSEWADNINLLVKPSEKSASGSVAHFTDGLDMPLVSLSCDVTAWQEGTGTASPSNPRAIHGWSEANVYRTGKNLVGTLAKTGVTINTSGEEVSNVNFDCSDYLYFKAGTYSVSCEDYVDSTTSSAKIRIGAYSLDNKTFISPLKVNISATATIGDITTASFTLDTDCYIKVAFNKSRCKNLQVEIGSSATTFSQYTGTTLNIPFGQTVYGGRLNVMTGELTITHGYYKVTGSETITRASLSTDNIVFKVEAGVPNVDNNENQISNIGTYNSSATTASGIRLNTFVIDANGDLYVQFARSDFANVEAFTTWLESNSVEVSFELATPTTITLTPHQMSSLLGENNIWADCGNSAVIYRGMVGDSFKCFFNSQVTSGWTGTSVERTMLTVTGNGNGSITFDNKGKGRTNCSNSDGYISVKKNGTAVYTKALAPNTDETLAIPVVNFSTGDVITLVFGFANYHSNINMKLTGDTFTVQGSATVSGISNTTNTSTTLEVST